MTSLDISRKLASVWFCPYLHSARFWLNREFNIKNKISLWFCKILGLMGFLIDRKLFQEILSFIHSSFVHSTNTSCMPLVALGSQQWKGQTKSQLLWSYHQHKLSIQTPSFCFFRFDSLTEPDVLPIIPHIPSHPTPFLPPFLPSRNSFLFICKHRF